MLASSLVLAAATASMTAPLWRGVDALVVECPTNPELCEAARDEANQSSPVPVTALRDDSPINSIGTLILVVRMITESGASAVEVSARRAVSIDESQGELLPKRYPAPSHDGAADVQSGLRLAMDHTLPWRAQRE